MMKKKASMTERERYETIIRGEKPDRIPVWMPGGGFCALYSGHSIVDNYDKPAVSLEMQRKTWSALGYLCIPMFGRPNHLAPEFGGETKLPEGEYAQAPMITRFPVQTVEDVWKLEMPDIKTAGDTPQSFAFTEEFFKPKPEGLIDNEPCVAFWEGGLFTGAANIPGLEKTCRWIIKEPDAVHRLMRLTTDYYIELARYWKATFGTEKVMPHIGEPSTANNIISPKQFERFVLPYAQEHCRAMLDMGYGQIFTHICGEQNLNLPYWAQINFGKPGFISVGHEIDLETAAKYFPDCVIVGNLEPAIIQSGTPDEVYEATRMVVEKGKRIPRGFIFAAGCELPPKSPMENIMAMTKAVNDFGWYE
jgi:uroporphyrinogen decarboxylase